MIRFTESGGALIFTVRVVPQSSKSAIVGEPDGALKIKLKAAPVGGAANKELTRFLAKMFDVPKSAVEIIKGQTSKTKLIKINGLKAANLPDSKSA